MFSKVNIASTCVSVSSTLVHVNSVTFSTILITLLVFNIGNNVNSFKEGNNKNEADEKVKIVETKTEGNKTIYSVTSKAWGVIKADVEVVNGEIKSIIVTDSSGETQWNEIEKNK